MRTNFLLLYPIFFFLSSCSGEPTYTGRELYFMAKEVDPSIEIVKITDPSQRILCQNYGEGCVKSTGQRVLIRRVQLIVVGFETTKQAQAEAKRLNQYYTRNWLLDDVTGEPVLEDFVKRVFKAKNPRQEPQLENK